MSERLSTPPEGRWTDRVFALTVLTFVLLTPPIITIFDVPVAFFGIPVLHIYCFGVWLAAIVGGGFLSARLARSRLSIDRATRPGAGPDGD